MVNPRDIKILPPIQKTVGSDGTRVIPIIRVFFSIRGEGSYDVSIPVEGFTEEKLEQAMLEEASKYIGLLDKYT